MTRATSHMTIARDLFTCLTLDSPFLMIETKARYSVQVEGNKQSKKTKKNIGGGVFTFGICNF